MVKKKTLATVAVTSFGVAMSAVYVTNDIQAEILDITWGGGNASSVNPFVTYGGISANIDQIDDVITSGGIAAGQFFQWNDTFGSDGIGRTMELGATSLGMGFGPMSMRVVADGEVIDPATFVGQLNGAGTAPGDIGNAGNGGNPGTTFNGTGSAFIAIRPMEAPGNLYWFKADFSIGGDIVYSGGQYGSEGEVLTVNGTGACPDIPGDINGDGAVTLLDVGPFVELVSGTADFNCAGDFNGDGAVTLLDVGPFVDSIGG